MTNKIYKENIEDWKLFHAAYTGGRKWREMKLLYQYASETLVQLDKRIQHTPIENHCEGVISTYSGFIWRDPPKRNFGKLNNNVFLNALLKDADREGTTLNEFMKQVLIWGSVFGVIWVMVDKPAVATQTKAQTKADEIRMNIRPYLRLYTPLDVTDWEFTPTEGGEYELTYFECQEEYNSREGEVKIVRQWTKQSIVTIKTIAGKNTENTTVDNSLGRIPVTPHYNKKSMVRGISTSDLQDIAGMQISIYNDLSELAQMIRGSNHKTLVKNRGDDATTGAGAVIIMDPDTLPGKVPYLLSADATALAGLLNTIDKKTEMINRMAHLTPVRTYRKQTISAIAMETEFQILNTLLSDKAAQLQQTEYMVFNIFCAWEGIDSTRSEYEVIYPTRFELRDKKADLEFIESARKIAVLINSVTLQREMNKQFARVALTDDDLIEKVDKELNKIKVVVADAAASGGVVA
jgi:hypothetical protein